MIKLTLNPEGDPVSQSFTEQQVIIGNASSAQAHFKIQDPSLHECHVKIIDLGSRFLAINAANDPFTSLNGLPFGKKSIQNQDRIQIGIYTILFEIELSPKKETPSETKQSHALAETPSEDSKMHSIQSLNSKAPSGQVGAEDESERIDIDALLKEVDRLDVKGEADDPEPQPVQEREAQKPLHHEIEIGDSSPLYTSNASKERPRKESLKADLNSSQDEANSVPQDFSPGSWKKIGTIVLGLVIFSALICGGIYFKASGKNSQEEKKIAAGTADIAMAMVHAQLNHIIPSKQNWADPDFIQNNLVCVLSPNLHSQAQLNDEGQFIRYPYILRVYTSGDMSRFLVIAQPAPNLLQWLVHKKAMVVDSKSMEMRKISDLKKLNRLLANPNPLDGKNGTEISKVVKEGTLMSLACLSGNNNNWGFPPPKALAFTRPGGENYIYNAPRYYPFSESRLRKAIFLTGHDASSVEVTSLREEIEELSKFRDIVLYTSQGLQASIDAQKALSTFFPNRKFLVGYVKFNEKGYVASSNIFINDDANDLGLLEQGTISSDSLIASSQIDDPFSSSQNERETNQIEDDNAFYSSFSGEPFVDTNHPLFLRLQAIAATRTRVLTPITKAICNAYRKQNVEITPGFNHQIEQLAQEFRETDKELSARMVLELTTLYQEYSEMPLEQFMKFIEASKLTTFIHEALNAHSEKEPLSDSQGIEEEIENIGKANSLVELDDAVQKAAGGLNLDKLPDPNLLIALQEKLYNAATDKLSDFLLSSESIYAKVPLKEQDRTTLIRILKTAWVTDPDEFEFFIGEFEHLNNMNK